MAPNHFGGRLAFAPDGKLFVTLGERFTFTPAQDLSTDLGKIVRINPDGSVPARQSLRGQRGRAARDLVLRPSQPARRSPSIRRPASCSRASSDPKVVTR